MKFFDEEKYKEVNQENKELVNDFLEYCNSVGRAKTTLKEYANNLRIMNVLLLDKFKNKCFVDLTKRDIVKLQNYFVNDFKMSPARVRVIRSSMSSLANYIENILDDEYKNYRNIILKIPAPVLEKVREFDNYTFEDAKKIADKMIEDKKIQQAFYLMLATACGARKAELLRLKMTDLNEDKLVYGTLYKSEKIKTKGRGNNLLNKFTIKSVIKQYLDVYKQYRNEQKICIKEIFYTVSKGEIIPAKICTANSYVETIKKYFEEIGVNYHSHLSRHVYITELLKQGLPLNVVKSIVGHKSEAITSSYDLRDDDELFSNYFKDGEIVTNEASLNKI